MRTRTLNVLAPSHPLAPHRKLPRPLLPALLKPHTSPFPTPPLSLFIMHSAVRSFRSAGRVAASASVSFIRALGIWTEPSEVYGSRGIGGICVEAMRNGCTGAGIARGEICQEDRGTDQCCRDVE